MSLPKHTMIGLMKMWDSICERLKHHPERLAVLLDQCAKVTGKTKSRLIRDGIRQVVEANLRGRGVCTNLCTFFRELRPPCHWGYR
jgi:hypothetical protein